MLRLPSLLVFLFCVGAAQAAPVEGVVMQVEGTDELFVNLGTRDGLRPGAVLRIFRRVVLEHPISKKSIEDRFPIGTVEVSEAGKLLSIVRSFKDLKRQPVAGDFVVPGSAPARAAVAADPATPCPPALAQPPAPTEPPEVTALHAALVAGLGEPPERRIELLVAYLEKYPSQRFSVAVGQTVEGLIEQLDMMRRAAETAPPGLIVRHVPVRRVEAQRPLALAIGARAAEPIAEVRLLARRKGDPRWITVKMTSDGIDHYSAAFPAALLFEPAEVQYAIEIVHGDGQVESVVGTLMKPRRLDVEPIPAGDGPVGPSHASFDARYIDFNSSGEGTDAYFQTEARFRYGVRFGILRNVEAGVGLISGEGGTVTDLANGLPSDPTSLGYAFAALELGFTELFGMGGRIISGNRRTTDDSAAESSIGVQLHVRIGEEDGMRLVAGLAAISELGSRYFGEFHTELNDRLPFTATIEATNLPVSAGYGARGVSALGWRANDWLTLRGELGLNVRTIKHYGYTVGGGLSFDWE